MPLGHHKAAVESVCRESIGVCVGEGCGGREMRVRVQNGRAF